MDAIKENTGNIFSDKDEAGLREVCKQLNIGCRSKNRERKLIDEIFGATSEHKYVQPTFIIDYPLGMSPLTKRHRSKAGLVERFELMVNGKRIGYCLQRIE